MPGKNKGIFAGDAVAGRGLPACGFMAITVLAAWLVWPWGPVQATPRGDLLDSDPLGRAAYCQQASDAELVVLASDTDWRVRSAAFDALGRMGSIDRLPMRDTPMGEREKIVLDWLDRDRPGLSEDICAVYARPKHVRFGAVLVERCLTCHAGRQPGPKLNDKSCVTCHGGIHADWSGTAHANSLSHLVLPTVDPVTRQLGAYGFEDRKGLSCVACHEPSGRGATHAQTDACLSAFTTNSCVTCHARTGAQWEVWTKAPRFRPATWPPGSVELVRDTEPESCVGCHMADGEHLWGARRDIELLRSGIVMKFQEEGGGAVSLVLQNLAGHAYPSGGVRRALRLYTKIDQEPEELVAVLADDLDEKPETENLQPVLQPGETRAYPLALSPTEVQARLVYVRNRFDPDSYTIQVESLTHQMPSRRGAWVQ